MASRTLLQLRTSVTYRGSYENSADITATLLTEFINEAMREVWDLMIERWADYYVTRSTLTTVSGTSQMTLPADFYKLRKLEHLISGTLGTSSERLTRVRPHDLDASHRFTPDYTGRYRYRLECSSLWLVPIPTTVSTLRLMYIPLPTVLSADADTFDGVNGYEELVIQLALLRCYKRQDLPLDETLAEIGRLTARIRAAADNRDAAEPFSLDPNGPRDDDWEDDPWL